jgi:hypothetical protein
MNDSIIASIPPDLSDPCFCSVALSFSSSWLYSVVVVVVAAEVAAVFVGATVFFVAFGCRGCFDCSSFDSVV